MKTRNIVVIFALALFLGNAFAFAEEAKMAAEQQAQMEKMKTLMAPSAAHKTLEPLAGKWNYTSRFWMSAEAKPEETSGTAAHAIIYGGRFLKQDVKGIWMGKVFEGVGYTGYDNIRQQYQSVWIDSMATGTMWMTGQYDEAAKTLNLSGSNSCPLTGDKDRQCRSEWKISDDDHNSYSSYTTGPDGKEFKAMEILYERTV